MTALTSLFPYVLLFAAYIKIKRKKVDKPGLYQMTKIKVGMLSWVYGIGNLRDCDCVLGTSGYDNF